MRWLLVAVPLALLALPAVLLVAIAFGPVILGILCAAGFALIVAALANVPIGLGVFGRAVARRRARG